MFRLGELGGKMVVQGEKGGRLEAFPSIWRVPLGALEPFPYSWAPDTVLLKGAHGKGSKSGKEGAGRKIRGFLTLPSGDH